MSRFPATDWPLVVASRTPSASPTSGPLAELCRQYWSPVYGYLRQRGHRADDAEDLTQSFFMHLITKRVLERAEPERGRLRSLLLACLVNFVANEQSRLHAQKRGGRSAGRIRMSIDAQAMIEPTDDMTPERVYERQWAVVLLRHVLARLRTEFAAAGKEQLYDTLERYLLGETSDTGYRDAAAALNVSEGSARVTVHRLRRRYRQLLWDEVARTLPGPTPDVAGEIRYLQSVMRGHSDSGGR